MKILNIARDTFLPLGVIAFKQSRMGAATIEGAFNTGIAGLNNLTAWRTNKQTNKTNLQIAQEANEAQHQLQLEQNDWNYNMWQENNEYNSPEAQRQRLVDAGMNPLLMNGDFSTGNSSSPAQGVDPMPQNVATMNPAHFDFNALLDLGQKLAFIKNTEAKTKGQEISNTFNPKLYASELEAKQASILNLNLQAKDLENALPWNSKKREQDWYIGESLRRIQQNNAELLEKTFEDRRKQFEWLPKISERQWQTFEKDWRLIDAEVKNYDAQTLVAKAQEKKLIAETSTIDSLRPEQLAILREQLIFTRLNSACNVLQVPTSHRAAFLQTLDSFGFDGIAQFKKGVKDTKWYREPNDICKALLLTAGVIMSDDPQAQLKEYLQSFQAASEHFDQVGGVR